MARTRAQENKAVRQEALRAQLAAQGHVQHVVDIIDKVEKLEGEALDSLVLQKYKLVIDTKLSLIKKYLPDTKLIELTGEAGKAINIKSSFNFIPVGCED